MTRASGLETWEKGSVAPAFGSKSTIHHQEVQHDRRPTGMPEPYRRRVSPEGPKYSRRNLVEETPEPARKRAD